MLNSNVVTEKTINSQVMAWYARYYNDEVLEEFNEDGTDNSFFDIDKKNLKEFGLYGGFNRFWYDTRDGVFHIRNAKGIEYSIRAHLEREDQSLIKITDKEMLYNDIVQYKKFYADLELALGKETPASPTEFYLGYKFSTDVPEGVLNVKAIFIISPFSKEEKVMTRFTFSADFDMNAYMCFSIDNNRRAPELIELKKNEKKEITIKIA